MKQKVLLPFCDTPLTTMYSGSAFSMGIIQANAKNDITPWLCGKYLNCRFTPGKLGSGVNNFHVFWEDYWAIYDRIIEDQRLYLHTELFEQLQSDWLMIFRKMLSAGYYVYGGYNEEFIPGKGKLGRPFAHDFLLIGYDNQAKVFHSVGHLKNGAFQRFDIDYEALKKAIRTIPQEKNEFCFRSFRSDASFPLVLQRITRGLSDYLSSRCSTEAAEDGQTYGLFAVEDLANLYAERAQESFRFDHRYSRGLMEHKNLMKLRIEYLYNNGYLSNPDYIARATAVLQLAASAHLSGVKYSLKPNSKSIQSVYHQIKETVSLEKEYLPLVLKELQRVT